MPQETNSVSQTHSPQLAQEVALSDNKGNFNYSDFCDKLSASLVEARHKIEFDIRDRLKGAPVKGALGRAAKHLCRDIEDLERHLESLGGGNPTALDCRELVEKVRDIYETLCSLSRDLRDSVEDDSWSDLIVKVFVTIAWCTLCAGLIAFAVTTPGALAVVVAIAACTAALSVAYRGVRSLVQVATEKKAAEQLPEIEDKATQALAEILSQHLKLLDSLGESEQYAEISDALNDPSVPLALKNAMGWFENV